MRQGIATLLSVEQDMALVAEAQNGCEAIQQFRAYRPDATFMDLQMPGMSGKSIWVALPVIPVSVPANAEHCAACLQADVNVFLTPPVS